MKKLVLSLLLFTGGALSAFAQPVPDPEIYIDGSMNDIDWKKCSDIKDVNLTFLWHGSYEPFANSVVKFEYKMELELNGNVIGTVTHESFDLPVDCTGLLVCPSIPADFPLSNPQGGAYQVHFTVRMKWFGIPISTEEDLYSNIINITRPDQGLYATCNGNEFQDAVNNCNDEMEIYQFEPEITLVVFKNQGIIWKLRGLGTTGFNMWGITTTPPGNVPGYFNYLGYQNFTASISDLVYTTDGNLLIGFTDGKILKVKGLGGSGQNMFAVNETSGGFSNIPGYTYYMGHHKFNSGISDLSHIGNYTLVSTTNGKILKANGSGGTGANMFAINETAGGFTGIPGYSYFVGSAKFNSVVNNMYNFGSQTIVTFYNGKMLKVNGTGGSGANFFAVNETGSGFVNVPGYTYYIGATKLNGYVRDMIYESNTLIIGFSNGKILKINGLGGSGLNMFAVVETPGSFSGLPGYTYYSGHAAYSAGVEDILYAGGHTFITFSNGKLMKIAALGGTGINMFNANETTFGFATSSTSYPTYTVGSSFFGTRPTDLKLFGSRMVLCFSNQKLFKAIQYGGTGYNCFAAVQEDDGFRPLLGYYPYVEGTQLFPCPGIRGPEQEETEVNEIVLHDLISVYPNPSTDNFIISFPEEVVELDEAITINVYNINGQVVYTESCKISNNITINGTSFAPGVYFIKINAKETELYTTKIIKQ